MNICNVCIHEKSFQKPRELYAPSELARCPSCSPPSPLLPQSQAASRSPRSMLPELALHWSKQVFLLNILLWEFSSNGVFFFPVHKHFFSKNSTAMLCKVWEKGEKISDFPHTVFLYILSQPFSINIYFIW